MGIARYKREKKFETFFLRVTFGWISFHNEGLFLPSKKVSKKCFGHDGVYIGRATDAQQAGSNGDQSTRLLFQVGLESDFKRKRRDQSCVICKTLRLQSMSLFNQPTIFSHMYKVQRAASSPLLLHRASNHELARHQVYRPLPHPPSPRSPIGRPVLQAREA